MKYKPEWGSQPWAVLRAWMLVSPLPLPGGRELHLYSVEAAEAFSVSIFFRTWS